MLFPSRVGWISGGVWLQRVCLGSTQIVALVVGWRWCPDLSVVMCARLVSLVWVIPEQCRVFIVGWLARVAGGRSALVSVSVLFILL
jgi:hypothetical protein